MARGFVIAGERSGVGKTSLTLAIVKSLISRGLRVQCFKVGPDFIDPGYHAAVSGRPPRNLDGWMMGKGQCLHSLEDNSHDVDLVVIEGVMGLFDGYDGTSEDGSTAQIAKWLNLPVILIIDGSSLARSAGAVALGFEVYDRELKIAGIIFNRVAGENHFRYLCDGVQARCDARVLGYVLRNSEWVIRERHLGLIMAEESADLQCQIASMSRQLEQSVNIDEIVSLARPISQQQFRTVRHKHPESTTIGVARDEAFCFYYQDNLDYLEQQGARLVFFSPIHNSFLPTGIEGLYVPGGYPELYAAALSRNKNMRAAIYEFCAAGKPVYAECGGLLYLLESLIDQHGVTHEMVGLFPAQARMLPSLQRLGYVEGEILKDCPFLTEGKKFRGHEFHYSEIKEMPQYVTRCYRVSGRKNRPVFYEGYTIFNTLASYIHVHFASNPSIAEEFVKACRVPVSRPS